MRRSRCLSAARGRGVPTRATYAATINASRTRRFRSRPRTHMKANTMVPMPCDHPTPARQVRPHPARMIAHETPGARPIAVAASRGNGSARTANSAMVALPVMSRPMTVATVAGSVRGVTYSSASRRT